jgi:hypothetical protein
MSLPDPDPVSLPDPDPVSLPDPDPLPSSHEHVPTKSP